MPDGGIGSDASARNVRLAPVSRAQETAILAALGDPPARSILLFLNDAPHSVQEIVDACALPQASVYRKLRELQEGGLVGIQRAALSPDGHRTDLFRSLLPNASIRLNRDRLEVTAAFRDLAAERLGDMWDEVRGAGKR
jgi:DNA-binding transcriptional ArsR family regulator